MTNRTYIRPYSAGMAIKRPRLKRLEISFDGPPPTPEGQHNGIRPHGGYRGTKQHPPGQFSFNKDESYQNELNEEYQLLVNNETGENHGAPYWLSDIQKEITHSGESPLFTSKLLATGKFEQEHGVINFERALLHCNTRRSSAPRRRHLNGKTEYYRPNSTHQYLSATDLRSLNDNEESIVRYGRPTRTTLLRARQRTGSAPVNAYDIRREHTKRIEDVKNNSIFCTGKELFEREQNRLSYRFYNIYATDGETMHSFLTGARYNRAHLLDSKGLSVYGVYMPREHPAECFMTGNRRVKDVGDDIPVAPPDSPRSDFDDTPTSNPSRHSSSMPTHSRPTSSRPNSSRPITRNTSSRPQSHRKTPPRTPASQSRSSKDPPNQSAAANTRSHPPRSADSSRRDPLPDEITLAMPDHINKAGKMGVYVTLKGQKLIESVESKLPRVTGVSLPSLRKSRDAVEEMQLVNQPPPTPVDISFGSVDRNRLEAFNAEDRAVNEQVDDDKPADGDILTEDKPTQNEPSIQNVTSDNFENKHTLEITEEAEIAQTNGTNNVTGDGIELNISKVVINENEISERKSLEIGPVKHVNFSNDDITVIHEDIETVKTVQENTNKESDSANVKGDNVVFFMTEDDETVEKVSNKHPADEPETELGDTAQQGNDVNKNDNENENIDNETAERSIDDVIKVEISEMDKKRDSDNSQGKLEDDSKSPITSDEFPFRQTN